MPIELDQPVRFLALSWAEEGWEYGSPTMILEPFVRFVPDGVSLEGVILKAEIDTCVDLEEGRQPRGGLGVEESEAVILTTERLGWKLPRLSHLRRVAREVLDGKEFPKKRYEAAEKTVTFTDFKGDIIGISKWRADPWRKPTRP